MERLLKPRVSEECGVLRLSYMHILRNLFLTIILIIKSCFPQAGYAGGVGMNKAPQDAWEKFSGGKSQDLIVVFDDSAIQAQASQLNKERGIIFDDNDTIRFKKDRYAAIKADVISALPLGKFEILKNYDVLPLMFLRFRSAEALKALLTHRSVLSVYEDRKENMMLKEPRP